MVRALLCDTNSYYRWNSYSRITTALANRSGNMVKALVPGVFVPWNSGWESSTMERFVFDNLSFSSLMYLIKKDVLTVTSVFFSQVK